LALVLSALKVNRLVTPSVRNASRTKWISSRLELALTVFMRTSLGKRGLREIIHGFSGKSL
jgi:hypothetical protein